MKKKLPDGREIEITERSGSISGKNKRTGNFEVLSIPKKDEHTGQTLSDEELEKRLRNGK